MSENNQINNNTINKAQLIDWLKSGKTASEYFGISEKVSIFQDVELENKSNNIVENDSLTENIEPKKSEKEELEEYLETIRKQVNQPILNDDNQQFFSDSDFLAEIDNIKSSIHPASDSNSYRFKLFINDAIKSLFNGLTFLDNLGKKEEQNPKQKRTVFIELTVLFYGMK